MCTCIRYNRGYTILEMTYRIVKQGDTSLIDSANQALLKVVDHSSTF